MYTFRIGFGPSGNHYRDGKTWNVFRSVAHHTWAGWMDIQWRQINHLCCLHSCNVQGGWDICSFHGIDSGHRVQSVQVDTCPHISCSLFFSQYISSSWFYIVHITKSHLHCLTLFFLPQIRDAYMLKIFYDNPARLPTWCNTESDKLPFCQILGEYRMELPEYNTIEPYAKMNENCPSLPPTYKRPARCWPWDCLLSLLKLLFTHWK